MSTITWAGTLTARSSIAHGGQTRGTITLLRRELIVVGDRVVHVPVISGNTLRGRLRRIGEELLRDEVGYQGLLSPAAAHVLRGGGALAKTGREPLSGSRLGRLRALVPQIGVFGAAAGGTIISGALDVGKVVPQVTETEAITGTPASLSAFQATQLEAYARQDDAGDHDFVPTMARLQFDQDGSPQVVGLSSNQMLFHIETFPAGTRFSTWLRLRRPTPVETSFFTDVLAVFTEAGRLGGRVGIGHGEVSVQLVANPEPRPDQGWRTHVTGNRSELLEVLGELA